MIALAAGAGLALIGTVVPQLHFLFSGAWFSAAIVSFLVHWRLARRTAPGPVPASPLTPETPR